MTSKFFDRSRFLLRLGGVLVAAAALASAAGREERGPLALTVGLADPAGLLEADARDAMRRELARLLAPAAIEPVWNPPGAPPLVWVRVEPRPHRPRITGCRRGRHDHRLGLVHLPSRHITVWSEQIARAATGDWDAEEAPSPPAARLGRALGRVLAHELGHLLLGLDGHRRRGLMRAAFRYRDLVAERPAALRLSAEDAARLRAALGRLRAEEAKER